MQKQFVYSDGPVYIPTPVVPRIRADLTQSNVFSLTKKEWDDAENSDPKIEVIKRSQLCVVNAGIIMVYATNDGRRKFLRENAAC